MRPTMLLKPTSFFRSLVLYVCLLPFSLPSFSLSDFLSCRPSYLSCFLSSLMSFLPSLPSSPISYLPCFPPYFTSYRPCFHPSFAPTYLVSIRHLFLPSAHSSILPQSLLPFFLLLSTSFLPTLLPFILPCSFLLRRLRQS